MIVSMVAIMLLAGSAGTARNAPPTRAALTPSGGVGKVKVAQFDAGVPERMNVQGYVTESDGDTLSGSHSMTFKLFDAGGTKLWDSTFSAQFQAGLFSAALGISASYFTSGVQRWLQVAVEGETLSPRVEVTSAAFAYRSIKSDTAGYASSGPVPPYADSAGGACRVGGLDITGLDGRFVNENEGAGGDLAGTYPNPTVDALQGRAVSPATPSPGQVLKWLSNAWTPATDSIGTGFPGYGTGATDVSSSSGPGSNSTVSRSDHTHKGVHDVLAGTGVSVSGDPDHTVTFDQTYGDGRYERVANKNVANGYCGLDASIKVPNSRLYTGAGAGLDADMLDGNHSSAFASASHNHDATYVNEGQSNSVTTGMITDGQVQTGDIADRNVTMTKINQTGASSGQVITWNGSDWQPQTPTSFPGYGTSATDVSSTSGPGSASTVSRSDHMHKGVRDVTAGTGISVSGDPDHTVTFDQTWGDARYVNHSGDVGNGNGQVPISNGTVCTNLNADMVDGSHASSFAPGSGSTNYIQNQNSSAQNANFWISGSAKMGITTCEGYVQGPALHAKGYWGIKAEATANGKGVYASSVGDDGVYSTTAASGKSGVCGIATQSTSAGVSGTNDNSGGYGVAGWSSSGKGVYGYTSGGTAVYGNKNGGGNYAGYFSGNVHVNGTLSKTSGSFLIDHPLDPLNRTLRHNFVESPENLCIYRGTLQLGPGGVGTAAMPSYFAALTDEVEATVSLTPVGRPFVASYEWNAGHTAFTAYGEPSRVVSYIVLADRDDPAMRLLRRPVEENKGGDNFEHGKLLCPAAYGYPETTRFDYRPDASVSSTGGER